MWARQLRSKCNLSMSRVSWQRSVILFSRLQNKVTHATFLITIRFSSDSAKRHLVKSWVDGDKCMKTAENNKNIVYLFFHIHRMFIFNTLD